MAATSISRPAGISASPVGEFGSWLRELDLPRLLKGVLDDYEVSAKIELSARAKESDSSPSLKVVPRRK